MKLAMNCGAGLNRRKDDDPMTIDPIESGLL
jgi:hypothetical protein